MNLATQEIMPQDLFVSWTLRLPKKEILVSLRGG